MPPTTVMRFQFAKLQYFFLSLVVAGSALFYVANTKGAFDSLVHHADRARVPFDFSSDPRWMVRPLPEALESGIRPQDFILSIDGVPFTGMAGLIDQIEQSHAGDRLTVTYRTAAGLTHTAHVSLQPLLPEAPTASIWLIAILRIALFPAFCLVIGYWVVLAKPHDHNAWSMLGIMNAVPVSLGLWGYYPQLLASFAVCWQAFAVRVMFISLVLLGVYFPVRSRTDRRHPWIKWLVIGPQIAIIPCTTLLNYGLLYHVRSIQRYLWAADPLHLAGNVFAAISLVVFIAAIVQKLFTLPDADAKRRLGVVAAGSLLGLGPLLAVLIGVTLTGAPFNEVLAPWMLLTLVFLFALFPVCLAYTVIVQRALDVRIFLRQGTRYALARGTLWMLQGLVLVYFGYRVILFSHESVHRLVHLATPIAFVLVVLFLRLRIAQPLSLWIDRRFFREEYSAELILSELSEQARSFTETGPLIRTIMERIAETLHVETLAAFVRARGSVQLQYAHGLAGLPDLSFPDDSEALRFLSGSGGAVRVSRENTGLPLTSAEEAFLFGVMQTELLLPLPGRSRLMGFLALGPKRSEEPYSPADRRLLDSVALQAGLSIENSELVHTLAEEEAQRQRMQREIEIAQEVQSRLFPQEVPQFSGLDLAGFCRTAQEIGGDYYDFFVLENGHLGIAIGDVSGKGISAALLMASMRASLRGLTLSGMLSPAKLIGRMNRIAFDSSASNRFATFFYGEFDPSARRLAYVNAGHNAPILLRSKSHCGGEIRPGDSFGLQRLDVGGPVMGVFRDVRYEQGELELQPCDVLVAFTDGLSESMNCELEEWGEERIIETVEASAHHAAKEIVSRLVGAADQFTAGAPQHDDLTLVVVKVR